MMKNKKADIFMTMLAIFIWILISLGFFIIIIGAQIEKEKLADLCKKECYKFDYDFYKLEDPGFF